MDYILKGDPKEVAKVLQENRIRVDRGVIEFAPCQQGAALDTDNIAMLHDSLGAQTKMCAEMAANRAELAALTEEVVSVFVENGHAVPEELAARLAEFNIIVPKIAETVPNTAEIADNTGESVPDTVPNNSENVEDNKTVEAEDMTEVNLDDVKDIEEADTKVAPAPTSKKTRSKKSE